MPRDVRPSVDEYLSKGYQAIALGSSKGALSTSTTASVGRLENPSPGSLGFISLGRDSNHGFRSSTNVRIWGSQSDCLKPDLPRATMRIRDLTLSEGSKRSVSFGIFGEKLVATRKVICREGNSSKRLNARLSSVRAWPLVSGD